MRERYELVGFLMLVGIAAVYLWKSVVRQKLQLQTISRVIEPLGFTCIFAGLETLPAALKAHPFIPQLDVFGVLAVWKGRINGLETYLIWKGTRNIDAYESPALGDSYMGMIVGCIRAHPPYLPECKLVPEFSFFGHVKRERAFNDSYWFEPPDDVIREVFSRAEVNSLFEKEKGWYFHNSREWAVVYRYSEKDVDSQLIREFIEGAFQVFRVLDDNWKLMTAASQRQ